MTFVTVVVSGRRNCSRCTRWRSILDFPPRKNRRGEVTGPNSVCNVCKNGAQRNQSPAQKAKQRRQQRLHMRKKRRAAGVPQRTPRVVGPKRYSSVDRMPLCRYLAPKVNELGFGRVAARTGVPERRLRAIMRGYDGDGKSQRKFGKQYKLRAIDFVEFDTVDKCFMGFDEEHLLTTFYPVPDKESLPHPSTIKRQERANLPPSPDENVMGEYRRRRRARKPRAA